jgi:WD40 repeat protein
VNAIAATSHINPFPGLRPFREDEEHLFFGRENQVDAMVDKLAATRFLAVVGTSGSGKSSLVNCGLRPALRQGLMAQAGTAWRMAQFRPGNNPIGALADALAQDGVLFRDHAATDLSLTEIIEATLRMSKLGLIDIFEQAALGEGANLLVVVDQFEELFRYQQLEAQRGGEPGTLEQATAFVNLLLEVKERVNCHIYIVLTMRSDFLGECTQFPGLAEAINAGQYLVPRMTRDERRAAIERPLGVAAAEMAPVLLTRLVNDVGDKPDQLSILQHALNRTFARWQSEGGKGSLELAHYEAIGTMAHALDQHAERAWADLAGDRQQLICEKLFKALTDKTDPRGVRRPTTLGTLCALCEATPAEVTEVIEVFRRPSRSFLMPPAGDRLKPETVIDISHESLMRVWERLIKWADEEAQSARAYRRLAEAADSHAAGEVSLWRDPELQLALDWRSRNQPNETWAARYHSGFPAAMQFLSESSEAREAERAERQRLRQRELDAQREKAESQARNARRRLWLTGISIAFALAAGIFGYRAHQASVIAEANRAEAQLYLRDAQVAKALTLIKAAGDRKNDQSRNVLLALETLPDSRAGIDRPVVGDAQKMLSAGIENLRELKVLGGYNGAVAGVVSSSAGDRIITSLDDGDAMVWDAATGARLVQLKGHTRRIRAVAVTPDGARFITGSDDGTARVWDAGDGTELRKFEGHSGPIFAVAASADGARIVTGSDDRTARIWDVSDGAELVRFDGHTEPVTAVAATPDGARVVTGSADHSARVWDASSGVELFQLKGHTGAVLAAAVTPDGTRIITGSDDRTARVWNASDGSPLMRPLPHLGSVFDIAVTPEGNRAVTASGDGVMRMWDIKTAVLLFELQGHIGQITGIAVSSDGSRIITGSDDDTTRVWDANTDIELFGLKGHTRSVLAVAIAPDGARIVTGSSDKTARIWDAASGTELQKLEGHTGSVMAVTMTPDRAHIVTGSQDGTTRIWDAATGAELHKLGGHTGPVWAVAVTPDGGRIITGSQDGTARIWDAASGAELLRLEGLTASVVAIAVTPDGKGIITGSTDGIVRVWDANTGAPLREFNGHTLAVWAVTATPDGARIVTGSDDRTVRIWEASTGRELRQLIGHDGPVRSVAVTPNEPRIVSGSEDGTLRVWDAGTGEERIRGRLGKVRSIAVTPDGSRVVAATDGNARVWALARLRPPPHQYRFNTAENVEAVVEEAKRVVPRCLTIEERKDFLLDPAPPGWCIDMGKYPYNTPYWQAWRANAEATDAKTSEAYADFADEALMKGGAIKTAFDAAELSMRFDPPPKKIWLTINHAHALMFLGQTEKARQEYLAHVGEKLEMLNGKIWESTILEDFQKLRDNGRSEKLMDEIEQKFKSLSVTADK